MPITSIPANDRYERFIAVGGQTVFPYNFPIYSDADLTVTRERAGVVATLAFGADYTVSGAGVQGGGNVTLTSGATASDVIVLAGTQQLSRTTAFTNGGDLTADALNAEFNRLVIGEQQAANAIRRALTLPVTDALTEMELPPVSERGGKIFAFDAAGRISLTVPVQVGPITASIFMAGVLLAADAIAARTAIGAASGLAQPDTTGTSTAYVLTAPALPGSLAQGLVLRTRAHVTCGDVPTLNMNGTGAKAVRRVCDGGTIPLGTSDWKAGITLTLMYDATLDAWVTDAPIGCQATLGQLLPVASPFRPKGTLWCDGAAISRTTYARLFDAMVLQFTGNTVSGNAVISAIANTSGVDVGMPLSGPNIPAGATVASFTGTSITMSANATGPGTGVAIVVAPAGIGDGTTTFNLPDLRGRAPFGRDDMNGTAASRLTTGVSGIRGTRLGAAGGDERMHQHTHTITDPGHTHPYAGFGFAGSTATGPGVINLGNGNTTSNTTGITNQNAGAGASQNVPPALVCNWVIFAGA